MIIPFVTNLVVMSTVTRCRWTICDWKPAPNCFYGLSYHHVELVKFESTQDVDIITISFLNRTVRIKGKNLRNLGVALQSAMRGVHQANGGALFIAGRW